MNNKTKLFASIMASGVIAGVAFAGNPYASLNPVTPANDNFSLIQQYGFDRDETLDYTYNPANYEQKRDEKADVSGYVNSTDSLPVPAQAYTSNGYARPGSNNMHFVKDENGKIRIQGF